MLLREFTPGITFPDFETNDLSSLLLFGYDNEYHYLQDNKNLIINIPYGFTDMEIVRCFLHKISINNLFKLYDKYIIPVTKHFEYLLPPPIGKNIILKAVRNG